MIKSVILSREADGLVFCESNDGYMDEKILTVKHRVKKYHSEVTAYSKAEGCMLKQIDHPAFNIFYKVSSHVVFTGIFDKSYPAKLANGFLDALIPPFFDEAKCLFGVANFASRLEAVSSDHYFIKFDRTVKAKKREFEDPTSLKNVDRMKRELESIHEIMRENMSLLEGRQEDLNQTEERARRINEESKRFDESSKKLLWQYWLRKNMIWVVLAATAAILYFLIF